MGEEKSVGKKILSTVKVIAYEWVGKKWWVSKFGGEEKLHGGDVGFWKNSH